MSVTSVTDYAGPFAPDGVATVFPFTFAALSADEVAVVRIPSDWTATTELTGYTVQLNVDNTGSVTFTAAPLAGDPLYIVSDPSFEQQTRIATQGKFSASAIEKAFDRTAVRDIVLAGAISRAPLAPPADTLGILPTVALRAGKVLGFDAAGQAVPVTMGGADAALRTDLAAALGGRLVGLTSGGTVQDKLDAFAGSGGSALIGHTNGATGARTISAQVKNDLHLDAREFVGTWDGVADDTVGFQAAVNEAVLRDATLHLPRAIKCGAITNPGAHKIKGEGGKTTIYSIPGNYDLFTLSSSDITFEDLYIDEAAKTSGATFKVACGTTRKERITLQNINTFNSYALLSDSGTSAGDLVTLRLRSVQARLHRGPGINLTRLAAFGFFNEVAIEYVGVSASNFTGFTFDGAGLGSATGGIFLDTCDVLGTSGTYTNTSQKGFVIQNHAEVHVSNSRVDTCDGDAWTLNAINIVVADDIASSICNGHGFTLTSITNALFSRLGVRGRNALSSPTASKDGIKFVSGCSNIQIGTALIRDCTGNGINKVAAQAGFVQLAGVQSISNTGRGIKTVGSSTFHMLGGATIGNTAGNYDLGATTDQLTNVMGNAGTLINQAGVATG